MTVAPFSKDLEFFVRAIAQLEARVEHLERVLDKVNALLVTQDGVNNTYTVDAHEFVRNI